MSPVSQRPSSTSQSQPAEVGQLPLLGREREDDLAHDAVLVARQQREGERARIDAAQQRIVDRHDLALGNRP